MLPIKIEKKRFFSKKDKKREYRIQETGVRICLCRCGKRSYERKKAVLGTPYGEARIQKSEEKITKIS